MTFRGVPWLAELSSGDRLRWGQYGQQAAVRRRGREAGRAGATRPSLLLCRGLTLAPQLL